MTILTNKETDEEYELLSDYKVNESEMAIVKKMPDTLKFSEVEIKSAISMAIRTFEAREDQYSPIMLERLRWHLQHFGD